MEISFESLETPALTKAQLAELLFDQIGLNKRESKDMIDAFFDLISQKLVDGEDVKISGFGNFQIFNTEGELLLFIGTRSARGGPSEFMLPAGISIDEDGRVYVIDQYLRKLDVFRPAAIPKGEGYFSRPKPATKKAS